MAKTKKKDKTKKEYTAEEIIKLVDTKQSSQAFNDMITQFETDFDLFALKEYEAEVDHQAYTSPAPRNDFMKVFSGINKADLTWHIMVPEDAPEEERAAANKGEALLTGIIDLADRQLRKTGEPSLREGIGWYGSCRGVAGLKCLVYTNEDKKTVFDIRPADALHLTWEKGADGLVWWNYSYNISKEEALQRYDIELEGDSGVILDFFTTKINAVVLKEGSLETASGQFVKEPTPHNLDHIPAGVFFAGGMPTVYSKDGTQELKYRAQSVYNASRNVYEPRNKQVSFIMDTAEKSVAGTLKYTTKEGKKEIKGDPFGSYKVVNLAEGETLEALDPPSVPAESGVILSILDRDKQESTVPYPIGYGIDPGGHSGAALSMMNDNMRSIYSPFTGMVAQAFQWLCEEILSQYKSKGQKMKLSGFDPNGKFYSQEFDPAEIQDDWYIQVKCEPKLPRDEAGELQMALAATSPRADGTPLLSDLTAYERIIKIQNPEAETQRIKDQKIKRMIENNPVIQIRRLALEMQQSGDPADQQLAQELLATIPAPGGQAGGQQTAGTTTGAPAPVQGQSQAGGQQIPAEVQQQLQQVAQQLGITAEEVAQMKPEEVRAALATLRR
jgi:hypothetical protein